jgi:hypothetical protein
VISQTPGRRSRILATVATLARRDCGIDCGIRTRRNGEVAAGGVRERPNRTVSKTVQDWCPVRSLQAVIGLDLQLCRLDLVLVGPLRPVLVVVLWDGLWDERGALADCARRRSKRTQGPFGSCGDRRSGRYGTNRLEYKCSAAWRSHSSHHGASMFPRNQLKIRKSSTFGYS